MNHPATLGRFDPYYTGVVLVVHLLAGLALWPALFSWGGLLAFTLSLYLVGIVGINLCYHRLLTHRSYAVPRWLEYSLATLGVCCMQDAPGTWVATHRAHHQHSDDEPDPHSPLVSFFWSHIGWLLYDNRGIRSLAAYDRYARDILQDPYYRWLQRRPRPVVIYLASCFLYFLLGWAISGPLYGASLLVWGGFLRTVVVWHISWSVNSLTHLVGYRNYVTRDDSRNNALVAFFSLGEGWHNNHHAAPRSASNWHRWWEVDPVWLLIRGLELVGLATAVIRPTTPISCSRE